MVVCESSINNIMGGIENTGGVTLHNHRRKLKQRFDIIKKLGQGTYGKVQLGINKETGQEVAIKTIKKCKIETEADLIRIRREIQIMSSVQHPNIIHIYEVFENREKMVLVMEYAAGGELYDYLSERKVLSEDEARRIFRQIATAVYYCHKHKICHRDLKLENILLDENGSAKIADFGLSNVFDERRLLSTFCGSPLYASPEIVKGTPYHGPEVDCWSLGVLLYTLVYGAMPFDGSNFKRLVKQISQGDYFEPKKPSSASPLIREMLTVIPEKRASIEKICAHWWVNANYKESCLDIAEELANQTPVRLDLLLSLAPPPPQVGSDQLVIAGESSAMAAPVAESATPARSQSVGSLMELVPAAERRIRDLVDDNKSPKRKLEVTVSTENANLSNSGAKRKEKLTKNDEPISESNNKVETKSQNESPTSDELKLCKNLTQTLIKEEAQPVEMAAPENDDINYTDPNLQGAACSELIEESKKNGVKEKKKTVKLVKKKVDKTNTSSDINQNKDVENKISDKENKSINTTEVEVEKKEDSKIPMKKKVIKKVIPKEKSEEKPEEQTVNEDNKTVSKTEEPTAPTKPVERRRSKIFETAEKFQNLLTSNDSKSSVLEKPKKIFIPGVNVGGFKKEFERKASLTSTVAPDLKKVLPKKTVPVNNNTPVSTTNKTEDISSAKSEEVIAPEEIQKVEPIKQENDIKESDKNIENQSPIHEENNEQQLRKKNAVSIISNAITKDGARKSKSRPCMMRKPPVPFGIQGRSASGSIGFIPTQLSSDATKSPELSSPDENNVKSSAEITLKSATLPRRKTTKAEIKLDYPPPRPATMEFKTEMAHRIEGKPELKTQRSEIIVPVNNNVTNNRLRSASLDPEIKPKESPKERIIPISFEKDDNTEKFDLQSPQAKPPMPKPLQTQRSVPSQRFGSFSRQSTHDSDSEATISENMEPIRKSPREYIIPIAVEGGGYVTPRATSLEPSDTSSGISSGRRSMPRFGRSKRMGENGSEEELSFSSLHRHNSVGRDSDNEDSRREPFHMHRLRSSRPTRKENLEHTDSLSSGEEDDDDGFEILTAENLFSTLLSRVRSLTQRLNVEDNGRLGFPNTRLLSNFDHGSKLWNLHNDTMSRFSPLDRAFHREQSNSSISSNRTNAPWRRSVSRDLATDIERVFNDTPTTTSTLPRDKSKKTKSKEANLCDLDLSELKLTDEDAIALSYLTPGLSRRIQTQLFSQLPTMRRDRSRKFSQNSLDNSDIRQRTKDYPFSDSSDSELFSDRNKYNDRESDDILNEYNFPRPPKHNFSSSRVSEYSPIIESPIMENKIPTKKVEPKIYRLEDIKKSYDKEKNEGYTKYTPYRHCYRSTSLIEPNANSYSNPLYFRNSNFSSESFDSKYSSDNKSLPNIGTSTASTKYNSRPYSVSSHSEEIPDPLGSLRKISRFGKTDYYDNCVYSKERKKREMETQKVLKEIRNKRINEHREKCRSRDKSSANPENNIQNNENGILKPEIQQEQKSADTSLSSECSVKEKSTNSLVKSDVKEEKNIKREGKISKLIRPKSYPTECINTDINGAKKSNGTGTESNIKMKLFKQNKSEDKSSPSPARDTQSVESKKQSNNQFLSSIEKKIRSLYSESSSNDKSKNETNSRIQSTIRSLREQSEPRHIETCVTESGLIKRAVSSEDFSVFGNKPNTKSLQPSRKSVSKILGLFKKYEDKPSTKAVKSTEESKKSKSSADGTVKKVKTKSSDTTSKSKTSSIKSTNKKECTCNADIKTGNDTIPKKVTSKTKSISKLPISSSRNSSVEPENNVENKTLNMSLDIENRNSSIEPELNLVKRNLSFENENNFITPASDLVYKPNRRDLKLNLNKTPDTRIRDYNDFLNDNSINRPENTFSPCDESNDSWSVCSDYHRQDMSPISDNKLYSEEESNESVIDRIRRKSFYCRFNEKKKPRKTSLVETKYDYKNYDKYADLQANNTTKSRSLKDCASDGYNKSITNSYAYTPKESKLCKRTVSMNDNDYQYSPHRYGGSKSNSNLSAEDKLLQAIDKNLNHKSKRSYLKTPTKFSDRITTSVNNHDSMEEPSTSYQTKHDVQAL